jgi:hypothetical protein
MRIQIQIPPESLATHRAEIMSLQHRRSFASSCRSCVLTLIFALSLAMVLRSVSWSSTPSCSCRCPVESTSWYFQRRIFINIETSSCFVSSLNVLFDLNSFQCVFVIFLKHLFSKASSFSSISLVDFQL